MGKGVVTILDQDYDTIIKVDGVEIHNGSGTHTRLAMKSLAESFARHFNHEVVYEEDNTEEYEDEVDHDWDTDNDYH